MTPDTDTTVYPGVEGVDIADAHRFLTLSSGFGHMPATDGKRIAGFFYSNDAAEAADAMPAHAMSAIKRIIAALAAKPIAGMDAGEVERLRETVQYLTGVPSASGVIGDFRAPEVDAAILRCRDRGDNTTAEIIAQMRLAYRARETEFTAFRLATLATNQEDGK